MMFCSNCGSMISADAKFCSNCGCSVSNSSVSNSNVYIDATSKIVQAKCTSCGAVLSVDTNYERATCPFCNSIFWVEHAVNSFNINNANSVQIDGSNVSMNCVNVDGYIEKAKRLYSKGQFTAASEYFIEALEIDFNNMKLRNECESFYYYWALYCESQDRLGDARTVLLKLYELLIVNDENRLENEVNRIESLIYEKVYYSFTYKNTFEFFSSKGYINLLNCGLLISGTDEEEESFIFYDQTYCNGMGSDVFIGLKCVNLGSKDEVKRFIDAINIMCNINRYERIDKNNEENNVD